MCIIRGLGGAPVSTRLKTLPPGSVAEWLCSGLQIRLRRFDSDPSLQYSEQYPININRLGILRYAGSPTHSPIFEFKSLELGLFFGEFLHRLKQGIHDVGHITG